VYEPRVFILHPLRRWLHCVQTDMRGSSHTPFWFQWCRVTAGKASRLQSNSEADEECLLHLLCWTNSGRSYVCLLVRSRPVVARASAVPELSHPDRRPNGDGTRCIFTTCDPGEMLDRFLALFLSSCRWYSRHFSLLSFIVSYHIGQCTYTCDL
jgi:hypothetical protein